jgi:hypothetical protein
MTDAYNAGRAAGIREAANAVTHEINKRYQLGVLRKRDLAELQFIRDRIDALLESAPAPAGVKVQEAAKVLLAVLDQPDQSDVKKGVYHYEWYRLDEAIKPLADAISALSENRT